MGLVRHGFVLAMLASCERQGVLGAPCERGGDCNDGLECDLHDGGGSCQAPHEDEPIEVPAGVCDDETRDDTYVLGLAKQGTWADVAFVDALPAPPSRGDNRWTIRVTDTSGTALPELDIEVDPFMPDHFHGTSIRCEVIESETPGEYVLEPLNLFMPGVWEVTVLLRDAEREDEVVFTFCVEP